MSQPSFIERLLSRRNLHLIPITDDHTAYAPTEYGLIITRDEWQALSEAIAQFYASATDAEIAETNDELRREGRR